MVRLLRFGDAPCAVTGLSLEQLREYGLRLEVDRINPARGYVAGNMQVVCSRINRARQTWGDDLPPDVVDDLREMVLAPLSHEARVFGRMERGAW